jgi:hypothetical protein
MKCPLTGTLKALSGTSTVFSSHRVILLEIFMILSSLKTQQLAKTSQLIMQKELRTHMKREDMDLLVMVTNGVWMKLRRIY